MRRRNRPALVLTTKESFGGFSFVVKAAVRGRLLALSGGGYRNRQRATRAALRGLFKAARAARTTERRIIPAAAARPA